MPERPVGNMYFAAWSHNVISNTVNLSNDLKMGEYLKISPRVMFLTQIWGTVFGAFINYVMMISIVTNNRDLLIDSNGNSSWSGATIQSYNTNAASWAMAKYLYTTGKTYSIVPYGLLIGAGFVIAHRIFVVVSLLESPLVPYANLSSVRTQDPRSPHCRSQLPPVHPVRRIHPLQPVANLRPVLPTHRGILCPILPPKLSTQDLPRLLVPGDRCLGWSQFGRSLHLVVCRLWCRRQVDPVPDLVGQQRGWELRPLSSARVDWARGCGWSARCKVRSSFRVDYSNASVSYYYSRRLDHSHPLCTSYDQQTLPIWDGDSRDVLVKLVVSANRCTLGAVCDFAVGLDLSDTAFQAE